MAAREAYLASSRIDKLTTPLGDGTEPFAYMTLEFQEALDDVPVWGEFVAAVVAVEQALADGVEPPAGGPSMRDVQEALLPLIFARLDEAVRRKFDGDFGRYRGQVRRVNVVFLPDESEHDPALDPTIRGGGPTI